MRNQQLFFYVLYNNSYTSWYPLFIFRKTFMAFTTILMIFLFFFIRNILISFMRVLTFFFLLLKDFDTFHEPLFEAFCCFSDSVQQSFLYMGKIIFDGFFILRFYGVYFYPSEFSSLKLFFIRIYFIRFIRGNLGIFFLLTTCLHSSRNTWG